MRYLTLAFACALLGCGFEPADLDPRDDVVAIQRVLACCACLADVECVDEASCVADYTRGEPPDLDGAPDACFDRCAVCWPVG